MPATIPHPTPHELPEFDSVDDERLHRKQRLAATFRLFDEAAWWFVYDKIVRDQPDLLD